eukprot:6311212-Amphidinium_carterae.1
MRGSGEGRGVWGRGLHKSLITSAMLTLLVRRSLLWVFGRFLYALNKGMGLRPVAPPTHQQQRYYPSEPPNHPKT